MLLIQVLNMSLTASYCILAVLAVRWLIRRAPKKYAYLLWLVVAFRLCCPVSLTSPLSLFSLGFLTRRSLKAIPWAVVNNSGMETEEEQGSDMPESAEVSDTQAGAVLQGVPGQDMTSEDAEWILLRTSNGGENSATWNADALKNAREGQALLEMANLDLYGVEEVQLEVSWECEELSVRVEYYEKDGPDTMLTEQRDMVLSRENGCFSFYLASPYDKLRGNGQDVRISFSHDGAEYLIRGFIPLQGREQRDLAGPQGYQSPAALPLLLLFPEKCRQCVGQASIHLPQRIHSGERDISQRERATGQADSQAPQEIHCSFSQ